MAVVLQSHSPHRFPSPLSSITLGSPMDNDGFQQPSIDIDPFINTPDCNSVALDRGVDTEIHQELQEECVFEVRKKRGREEGDQISLLTVLVTVFKKSLVSCRSEVGVEDKISSSSSSSSSSGMSMKISWPTNVRHVSHVTFDRFNGFLGLPVEFEPEVPRRPPSASTRVFGVSTESMQLSFDSRGNSVPTILLMMQRRLYAEGGLQAEGIFRINPDNAQEEYVREQLNMGVVPDNVDIHCLAGLIKAWFRELPTALLDCIPPEEVMQAQSEEQSTHLVKLLPPTEAALLDWAINLMADVAQMEHLNKMNSRNIAMVFAPNMTKMADPLTALMFAVKVMNFLKILIERTLKNRVDSVVEIAPAYDYLDPSDENGDYGLYSQPITREKDEENEEDQLTDPKQELQYKESDSIGGQDEKENHVEQCLVKDSSKSVKLCSNLTNGEGRYQSKSRRTRIRQSSNSCAMKGSRKLNEFPVILAEMGKETSIISRINPQKERVEAWR